MIGFLFWLYGPKQQQLMLPWKRKSWSAAEGDIAIHGRGGWAIVELDAVGSVAITIVGVVSWWCSLT